MSDTLILRYPLAHADAQCAWLRVDSQAAAHAPVAYGSLHDAAVAAEGARVVLVLSGHEVSLIRAELPPKSAKRLATLVPYALEDQLAAEIETLHFAIGTQDDVGIVETAVVDRETLTERLAALAEHGLSPVAAYGSTQLTPVIPATTTLLVEDHWLNVRTPAGVAYSIDLLPDRPTRMTLALNEGEPSACVLYTDASTYAARRLALPQDDGLPAGGQFVGGGPQLLEFGPLQKYAEIALHEHPINLLQGAYAPLGSAAAGWARWRTAVFVLLGCVLVNVLISSVDIVRAHRTEARLDSELHAAYAQALPGIDPARLPAPRLVVESRMHRLMSVGQEGFIGTLDRLGSALASTSGVTVKSINYHDGSLEAVLAAGDLASLNRFQQAVGADAQLAGVSTPDEQHATGRLEIRGGNP
jgi:general secretion pathway protein L